MSATTETTPQLIRIVKLRKTCSACPAQWEGETDAGAAVYIRYRYGELRVHVGPGLGEAINREAVFTWESEDPEDEYDGEMSESELKGRVPSWIEIVA